ncbi:MAG: hypothetical protein LBB53_02960 [Prevotellaceae bacterium]|jgi:hypothetical protein|nr:hypothetical protein [Prevotellaceae bacterium]
MKTLLKIKQKFNEINTTIFDEVIFVVDEKMAVNRLKDNSGFILLVAYPAIDRIGSQDNPSYEHDISIWSIKKARTGGVTFEQEDNEYNVLQLKLKEFIAAIEHQVEHGCSFFRKVQFDTFAIDPVYRVFGGFNGWYMNFKML